MNDLLAAIGLAARLLLCAIFGVAGLAKFRDIDRFQQTLEQFGAPAHLALPLARAVPTFELLVSGCLLFPHVSAWTAGVAVIMLLAFSAVMARSLVRGRRPSCQCFGELSDEPIGWFTLARNAAFIGLAALVLIADAHATVRTTLSPAAISVAGIGIAVLCGQSWLILLLFGRQRGLAQRLSTLEARLSPPALGLPVGVPAPPFIASVLKGGQESLANLLEPGKPVLLFFFDPDCDPCKEVLPSIARWQVEHADRLRFVLLGRKMGKKLNWPEYASYHVLCQDDREIAQLFKVPGIPAALIISPDGRIHSPLAVGHEPIHRLVVSAVRQAGA